MSYAFVDAYIIVLAISLTSCQKLSNCTFGINNYLLNQAVYNQIQFNILNTTVLLTASYYTGSLPMPDLTQLGLIYSNYIVPFPIMLVCPSAQQPQSCQYNSVYVNSRQVLTRSEPITVPLIPLNYTGIGVAYSLYLPEGHSQLTNCTLGQNLFTDETFLLDIEIKYERLVGNFCNPLIDTCGSSYLTYCSPLTGTCTCNTSSSIQVSTSIGSVCADTVNASNCAIFPTRCVYWCNSTQNNLCICPSDTVKVLRSNVYVCELPLNGNCSLLDIRRCPPTQCCVSTQCIDCTLSTETVLPTTTTVSSSPSRSLDDRLKIALGVVAGVLGTIVIILTIAFCWLKHRHKRLLKMNPKSTLLSTVSSSTPSSLYTLPTSAQHSFDRFNIYQPNNTTVEEGIYSLSNVPDEQTVPRRLFDRMSDNSSVMNNEYSSSIQIKRMKNRNLPYRTDSFRKAVGAVDYSLRQPSYEERVSNNVENITNNYRSITPSNQRNTYHQIIPYAEQYLSSRASYVL
ncbi:unnamed protein product [Didymodactylos carnosus]|uniref:Uncharacterized protein n=1 Tax=Didymodactylos carnosus TaxID=1234261 RepID=A0A815IUP3_9BILA|nr:unnamed protein product [Didymodactylos carnosus]CAF1373666.1 unnamed protein product [Didymodactylos carnosus]CAF3790990.1 unnamed protein product [Didymodactylos carnosus]CAF4262305.1 unnamed protein product [Didymodactylos carnosus]